MSHREQSGGSRIWTYLGGIAVLGVGLWFATSGQLNPRIDPQDVDARVEHIMRTTPLIDGHNDIPYLLRLELKNKIYDERFTFDTSMPASPLC